MFTIYLVQIATVASIVYLVLGPLVSYFRDHKGFRRFPNLSKFAGVTNIPYMVATFYGNRYEKVNHAHIVKKQPIVRVGPNHISFGRVEAIKDIYGHQTKTTKSDFYKVLAGEYRHLADVQDRSEHARKRKVLSAAFAHRNVIHWEHILNEKLCHLIKHCDAFSEHEEPMDYRYWTNLLTIDVISSIALDSQLNLVKKGSDLVVAERVDGSLYNANFIHSLHEGLRTQVVYSWSFKWYKVISKLTAWQSGWKNLQAFNDIVNHLCRQRLARDQAGDKADDFVHVLLYDRNGRSLNLPLGEITAECSIMLNAGSETTAVAMTNVIYLLLKNPVCMQKLRKELEDALGEADGVPTHDEIKLLPYLRACLDESLRMYPPTALGLPRDTPSEGATIMGEWIPGNTTVSIAAYTAHRDPSVWKDADVYQPERWLEESGKELQRYFIPFSAGARGCIGRNISYLEQYLCLASILHRYDIAFAEEGFEMKRHEAVVTWPGPMPLKLRRRHIMS